MVPKAIGLTRRPPTQDEELRLNAQGFQMVAGIDEVGRGPLAGPVVAAAVVLPSPLKADWLPLVRDSKQLTALQRERAFEHIQASALAIGIGMVGPGDIDVMGIVAATRRAMREAVLRMPLQPQHLLIDALSLPDLPIPQKAIIHGDAICLSIAAASIVAKVTRDRLIAQEDTVYPGYDFKKHKGYATREHLSSLRRLGPCAIHRRSFAPVRELVDGARA